MFRFKVDEKAIELLNKLLKKHNLSEIEVKSGSKSIRISKINKISGDINANVLTSSDNPNKSEIKDNQSPKQAIKNTIKAPMLGTLYHAPSPKAEPFIKVGSKVKSGDVIFIIEAMKTMNQVKSDRSGTVKKILVENGLPIEFNQDLVIIE